jgi:DNA repair protein RadC
MKDSWKAGELALTYKRTNPDGPKIVSSRCLEKIIRPMYGDEMEVREKFYAIGLSRSNKLRSCFELSAGSTSACLVDPKLLFSRLLLDNCSGFALCHNHPSGNTKPSSSDIDLTRNLKAGAKLLDLVLLDHIILTQNSKNSFADLGLL